MDQTEFQRALKKFERQKQKRLAAQLSEQENPVKVNPSLPFNPIVTKPKPEKPVEHPRPQPKALEINVTGPVSLNFSIEWTGTLMGGQMNEHAMTALFIKHLSALGRVKRK